MQPTPASTISVAASDETSQPLVVRPDIVPALNDPMRLGSDPERAQFVGAESPSESASVSDSAELSLIRGYIAPDNQDPIMQLPCTVHGQWPVAARVNISDISHMSRPPSACSSSSDASGYTLSSDTSFT
ncbi:uncharacterized protein PHACADRAFT_255835 [Phanerochaete carnosa HHB-10118-sp]|uniref:Uncharacterized protein n=1 Tax=Phanerochaete carnosa (strain HHB-10118-sp) TaxID=650164 RepID=K5WXW8_PHACS|nr:uncharacterized protein PHACADRAFT_255835 [Phanerochaete carnosa HHB-10118-sp]EKM55307.1 hypothetical protein PHACADRAFT_255835 [Phanerochaete carnosa HHB-10118-sp]